MSTNAFGQDFWIGKRFHSKDPREAWRHVVITDIRNGKAKCHVLLRPFSDNKMNSRGTMISLKGLSDRWKPCSSEQPCSYCPVKPETV